MSIMKRIIPVILVSLLLGACNNESSKTSDSTSDTLQKTSMAADNNLTEQEKSEGWQLLFDGQSTTGWHQYGGSPVGSAWKIQDGALFLDASQKEGGRIVGGGDIVTDQEFENFHLKVDWKVDTGANSGIMFYVHEDAKYKAPWETGPEMQVLDNEKHPDARIVKHRAGDLYDIISSSKEMAKPALEWNQAEIRAENGKLDFWLNGENIVSTTLWDENWKQLIRDTKWKDHKDFSTYKKGKIALQDHGDKVWFKNIKLRRL